CCSSSTATRPPACSGSVAPRARRDSRARCRNSKRQWGTMSTPEIDERFDDLVRELRTLPGAPDELRARVRALGEREPERPRRPRAGRLVLVVACLALLGVAGIAAVYGLVTSGGSSTQ